jgi:hypothetical protein
VVRRLNLKTHFLQYRADLAPCAFSPVELAKVEIPGLVIRFCNRFSGIVVWKRKNSHSGPTLNIAHLGRFLRTFLRT